MVKQKLRENRQPESEESESVSLYSSSEQEIEETEVKLTNEEIRLQRAKEILSKTKEYLQSKKKEEENEEFFIESENEIQDEDLRAHFVKENLIKQREDKKYLAEKVINFYKENNCTLPLWFLKGHKQCITNIAIQPKSQNIFSVSKDGCILVFIKKSDYKRQVFQYSYPKNQHGHKGEIYSIAISFDGLYLATGGQDQTVKVWDIETQELHHSFAGHKQIVTSLQFKLNSYDLISGAKEGQMIIWDAKQKGKIEQIYAHKNAVFEISNLNNNQILSTGYDWRISLTNLEQGKQLVFDQQKRSIECIVALNKHNFATGNEIGEISLWTKAKKKPNKTIQVNSDTWITGIEAPFNGDLIICSTDCGQLKIYQGKFDDLKEMEITEVISLQFKGIINCIKLSEDNSQLFLAIGNENKFGRWKTNKQKSRICVLNLF